MKGEVIAIGGNAFSARGEDPKIERFIIGRARQAKAKIAYLPNAMDETTWAGVGFYQAYHRFDVMASHLSLFKPHTADLESYLLEQDIIFVGGGNTRSMLALWREWGVDGFLRKAAERGTILAGVSAGANCWFEQCTTDSIPGRISIMSCLGFLEGSFTPHYHGEADRRPALEAAIQSGEIKPGYAVDDGAAVHLIDGKREACIAWQPNAQAYWVENQDGGFVEEELPMTAL